MTDTTETLVYSSDKSKHAPASLPVRVGAEFAGSFFVIFITLIVTGLLGPANNQIPGLMAVVVTLTLAAAYGITAIVFGKVSGGQINPAVTFAAALTARISWLDALLYIIAQLLGGAAAAAIAVFMAPTPITNTGFSSVGFIAHMANLYDQGTQQFLSLPTVYSNLTTFDMRWTIVLEVIAVLAIVATYLATSNRNGLATRKYGMAMAMAYGLGALVTYPFDHAGLNPARSTGIAIFAQIKGLADPSPLKQLWVFWVTALLASAVAALVVIIHDSVHANDDAIYREIQFEEQNAPASDTDKSSDNAAEQDSSDSTGGTTIIVEQADTGGSSENGSTDDAADEDAEGKTDPES